MERIQYAAIRLALGYRISTPTNILVAESKLTYLQDRIKFLCSTYLSKIITNRNLPVTKTIHRYNTTFKKVKKKSRILVKCIPEILLLKKILPTGPQYNVYYLQNYEVLTEQIDYNSNFGIKLRTAKHPEEIVSELMKSKNAIDICEARC